MALGTNNDSELALLKTYFDSETTVIGLYNDSTDSLTDTQGEPDISTEPTGSNYARQNIPTSDATVSIDSGKAELRIADKTFDTSNSSQDIDAAFIYNADDGFFLRLGVDTSSYANDYVPLSDLDNLQVGGDALTLD